MARRRIKLLPYPGKNSLYDTSMYIFQSKIPPLPTLSRTTRHPSLEQALKIPNPKSEMHGGFRNTNSALEGACPTQG